MSPPIFALSSLQMSFPTHAPIFAVEGAIQVKWVAVAVVVMVVVVVFKIAKLAYL